MKKDLKKVKGQSVKELEKEIAKLKTEIVKEALSMKVNPPKDINGLHKKRKLLALHLTVISEKKELEQLEKTK